MKYLLLPAFLLASATAASATPSSRDHCERIRIAGSNAFYHVNSGCVTYGLVMNRETQPRRDTRKPTKPAEPDAGKPDDSVDSDGPGEIDGRVDDGNNGHGNDPGRVDPSNPGKGGGNQGHDDNGHGNDPDRVDPSNPGKGGGNQVHDDNGHGYDPGGVDSSNPGKGGGKSVGRNR
jgi:hypothetical protein